MTTTCHNEKAREAGLVPAFCQCAACVAARAANPMSLTDRVLSNHLAPKGWDVAETSTDEPEPVTVMPGDSFTFVPANQEPEQSSTPRERRIEAAAKLALAWMENTEPTAGEFAEAREALRKALA